MTLRTHKLFVISGPSGAGKGTLLAQVLMKHSGLGLTVSATTRSPRSGEVDGVNYYFITDQQFNDLIDEGAFLEWAYVHDHKYGTLVSEISRLNDEGKSSVLEIDVQGALNVRKVYPEAVLIFIAPPSIEELEGRLRNRGTEDEATISLRMKNAKKELELASTYDTIIVNDELETAVESLIETIDRYEKN